MASALGFLAEGMIEGSRALEQSSAREKQEKRLDKQLQLQEKAEDRLGRQSEATISATKQLTKERDTRLGMDKEKSEYEKERRPIKEADERAAEARREAAELRAKYKQSMEAQTYEDRRKIFKQQMGDYERKRIWSIEDRQKQSAKDIAAQKQEFRDVGLPQAAAYLHGLVEFDKIKPGSFPNLVDSLNNYIPNSPIKVADVRYDPESQGAEIIIEFSNGQTEKQPKEALYQMAIKDEGFRSLAEAKMKASQERDKRRQTHLDQKLKDIREMLPKSWGSELAAKADLDFVNSMMTDIAKDPSIGPYLSPDNMVSMAVDNSDILITPEQAAGIVGDPKMRDALEQQYGTTLKTAQDVVALKRMEFKMAIRQEAKRRIDRGGADEKDELDSFNKTHGTQDWTPEQIEFYLQQFGNKMTPMQREYFEDLLIEKENRAGDEPDARPAAPTPASPPSALGGQGIYPGAMDQPATAPAFPIRAIGTGVKRMFFPQ
jgi:hypothetical protein